MKLRYFIVTMLTLIPIHAMEIELSNDERFNTLSTANLFKHIETSDLRAIRRVIKNENADPNAICSYIREGIPHRATPLEYALLVRHESPNVLTTTIETLIQLGADINKKNPHRRNFTPLHTAANFCDESAASLLLQREADARAVSTAKFTPLHILCRISPHTMITATHSLEKRIEDQKNIARLLLQAGPLEKEESDTIPPLVIAAVSNNHHLIPIFIEHGATLDTLNDRWLLYAQDQGVNLPAVYDAAAKQVEAAQK